MNTGFRYITIATLGGALWLILAIAPPGSSANTTPSLTTALARLAVSPAFAEDNEHESAGKDEEADEHDDEGKKGDETSEMEDDHHDKKHEKKHDDD